MVEVHPVFIGMVITIILGLIGLVWRGLNAKINEANKTALIAHEKAISLDTEVTKIKASCQVHKTDILTMERFSVWAKDFEGGMEKKISEQFQGFKDALFRELLENEYIKPKGQRKAKA